MSSRMQSPSISADELRKLMQYEPDTGRLRWAVRKGRMKVGDATGSPTSNGYLYTCINRKLYANHRLVWLYVHGQWPRGVVDHINGVKTDNRISNLRDVDDTTNIQNMRKAHKDSKTGVLGVTRFGNKFRAYIWKDRKSCHLGIFETADQAHSAYVEAKRKLHAGCTL